MDRVELQGDYDLRQASFWARFHTDSPAPMGRSDGPALFMTRDGAFFVVAAPVPGPWQSRIWGDQIKSKDELQAWLEERCDFILSYWRDR